MRVSEQGGSGVADCPCCGEHVMVSDWRQPELCDTCEDHGCDPTGQSPCECVCPECDGWGHYNAKGLRECHGCGGTGSLGDFRERESQ